MSIGAVDAGRKPSPHRRMSVNELAEVAVERMLEDFFLGQAHNFATRDLHSVQTQPLWVDAKVTVRRILLAEAEVLARLRRILAHPELQGRLLSVGQSARDLAGSAQERVHPLAEFGIARGSVQDGCYLDPNLGDRKSTRLNSSHRTISYAVFCLKKKKKKKKTNMLRKE